ncbi:energy transducer TonB [Agarivorans sp. Z349TD_8]|uniref:energy transducer TonB n=1 Tax=Agarivorans sp. Z349TD_8 TaxID=3421434 RepID=UPI003D7D6DC9
MGKLTIAIALSAAIHAYFILLKSSPSPLQLNSSGDIVASKVDGISISTKILNTPEQAETPFIGEPNVAQALVEHPPQPVMQSELSSPPAQKPKHKPKPQTTPTESIGIVEHEKQPPTDAELHAVRQTQAAQPQQTKKTPLLTTQPKAKPVNQQRTDPNKLTPEAGQLTQTTSEIPQLPSRSKPSPQQGLAQLPRLNSQPQFAHPPKAPVYPRLAKKRGQQGKVIVEVWLDPKGRQIKREISTSSGISSLDQAALNAVQQWPFKPLVIDGQAQMSRVFIPIKFKLS